MRFDGRYTMLAGWHGPVTAVLAFRARAGERARAYSPLRARSVMRDLSAEAERGDRHDLVALYQLLTGDEVTAFTRIRTEFLSERVLGAVEDGRLLLIRGWSSAAEKSPSVRPHEDASDSLVARVMAGKAELSFEGRRFLVLTRSSWNGLGDRGTYEILRQDEAVRLLHGLATRSEPSQKAALIEVARLLAESSASSVLLVRRVDAHAFSAAAVVEPAMTPSQLARRMAPETDWIEIVVTDQTGRPYNGSVVLMLPDGGRVDLRTDENGLVRLEGVKPGDCRFSMDDHQLGVVSPEGVAD